MPYFSWFGYDQHGDLLQGDMYALSREEALHILHMQGMRELRVVAYNNRISRISLNEKAHFFYNLHALMSSGLHLYQALTLIVPTIKHKHLRIMTQDTIFLLDHGYALSAVWERYPAIIDVYTLCIIRAAEEAGLLVQALSLCAHYWTMRADVAQKIRTALLGPALIALFFLSVVLLVVMYLIPAFKQLIDTQLMKLNPLSSFLFTFSDYVNEHTVIVLVFLGVLIGCIILCMRSARVQSLVLKLPFIRTLVTLYALSSWLTAQACMLQAGVPLLVALQRVAQASLIPTENLIESIEKGNSFAESLRNEKIFPAPLVGIVHAAEEAGTLAPAMSFAARMYTELLTARLALVAQSVQPVLIVVLGLCIGLLIVAMYMPLIEVPLTREMI